jgi:NAD(P)H-dependent flavin oxidoreductase YrpB (nitropropane dioxygenase family)
MGPDLAGPELVAAVCNAGGFGILQAQLCPPPLLRDQIRHLRTLTDKQFGVNFVLHFPHRDGISNMPGRAGVGLIVLLGRSI